MTDGRTDDHRPPGKGPQNYSPKYDPSPRSGSTPPNKRTHLHLQRSLGQRAADSTAALVGSWPFIWGYLTFTAVWCLGNTAIWIFDRYPYPFYTFSVSVLAILMSALILLSQNRQAQIDRARDDHEAEEVDLLLTINQRQLQLIEAVHLLASETTTDDRQHHP